MAGQNGRGGGAVAGFVVGQGSDFLDHLRAHVLELPVQFPSIRIHRFGDARCAEGFVHHVPPLGPRLSPHRQGCSRSIRLRIGVKFDVLSSHVVYKILDLMSVVRVRQAKWHAMIPMMSLSSSSAFPSTVTSVPDHLPNRILSPGATAISISRRCLWGASADNHDHLEGFLGGIGDDQPAGGFLSLSVLTVMVSMPSLQLLKAQSYLKPPPGEGCSR